MSSTQPAHQRIELTLHISAERFLNFYRGAAQTILARARDGRSVSFPCNLVQPFVQHDGIHGNFVLELDANNRCIRMRRQEG